MFQDMNFSFLFQMPKAYQNTLLLCNANLCLVYTSPKSDVRKRFAVPDMPVEIRAKLPVQYNSACMPILLRECIRSPNDLAELWHVFCEKFVLYFDFEA